MLEFVYRVMLPEVAHQAALMPVLALIIILGLGKVPSLDQGLLTTALGMSWIGDSQTSAIGGGFEYGHLWAPAQIALAYAAVVENWKFGRVLLVGALCVLVLTVSYLNVDPGVLLWPLGGIGLVILGRKSPVRVPIFVYFGVGTIAFVFMIWEPGPDRWLPYQACRIAALAALCIIILAPRKELRYVVSH